MESNAIKYEIIKKSDVSFIIPVDSISFGDGVVTATTSIGDIVFQNPIKDGNLENPEWAIRQVGTNLTPNNDGVVSNTGVEIPVTPEVASEIAQGKVDVEVAVPAVNDATPTETAPVVDAEATLAAPEAAAPAEVGGTFTNGQSGGEMTQAAPAAESNI